jgi:hypothetical protein
MQRQPLGEAADRQKIQSLLKGRNPGWMQTRLCALKMGFSASNTKAFIAKSLGVSERTVARWFTVYRQHGLDAVLKRGYPIFNTPMAKVEYSWGLTAIGFIPVALQYEDFV